jgi:hypothetical protein
MTLAGHPTAARFFSKSGGGTSFEYALKHNMIAGKTLITQPAHSNVLDGEGDKSDDIVHSSACVSLN